MNELTQAQYMACFGTSNMAQSFESTLLQLGIKYTMRKTLMVTYPMVYLESMPIEYKQALEASSIERLREMRRAA